VYGEPFSVPFHDFMTRPAQRHGSTAERRALTATGRRRGHTRGTPAARTVARGSCGQWQLLHVCHHGARQHDLHGGNHRRRHGRDDSDCNNPQHLGASVVIHRTPLRSIHTVATQLTHGVCAVMPI
jgi:hypothetical protein